MTRRPLSTDSRSNLTDFPSCDDDDAQRAQRCTEEETHTSSGGAAHQLVNSSALLYMVAVRAPLTREFSGLVTVNKAFCVAHHNTLPERFLRQPPSPIKNLAIVHACARHGLAKRFVNEARHLAAADASGGAAVLDPIAVLTVLTCGIHVLSGACKRGDADDVIDVIDRWPWPQQHVEGFKVRDTCFTFDVPHVPELERYDTWLETDTRRVIGSHALCHVVRSGDAKLLAALHAAQCAGRLRANLARESSGLEMHCAVQLRSEPMLRLVLSWPGGVAKLVYPTTLSLATATLPLDALRPLLNGMSWPQSEVYQAKALSGASSRGRADVVKLLLQPPYLARANACQSLALIDAVKNNHVAGGGWRSTGQRISPPWRSPSCCSLKSSTRLAQTPKTARP